MQAAPALLHQGLQVASVVAGCIEGVVVAVPVALQGEGIQERAMEAAKGRLVVDAAPVAEIVQVVADGLHRHDQGDQGFRIKGVVEGIEASPLGVEALVLQAGGGLHQQRPVAAALQLPVPALQLSGNLGQHGGKEPPQGGGGEDRPGLFVVSLFKAGKVKNILLVCLQRLHSPAVLDLNKAAAFPMRPLGFSYITP